MKFLGDLNKLNERLAVKSNRNPDHIIDRTWPDYCRMAQTVLEIDEENAKELKRQNKKVK